MNYSLLAFIGLHIDAVTMLTIYWSPTFALRGLRRILIRAVFVKRISFISGIYFKIGETWAFLHIQHFFGQQYMEKKGAQIQRENFRRGHLYHLGS